MKDITCIFFLEMNQFTMKKIACDVFGKKSVAMEGLVHA